MNISTSSGAHLFRPQCLVDAYAAQMLEELDGDVVVSLEVALEEVPALLALIDSGRCPRCGGSYMEGEIPSGSRITECRCVPVCMLCGEAETFESLAWVRIGGPDDALAGLLGHIANWPIDRDEEASALAEIHRRYFSGPAAQVELADLEHSDTGGRASHGYDDTEDAQEREGR